MLRRRRFVTLDGVVEELLDRRLAEVHLPRDDPDDVVGRSLANLENAVQGSSLEVRQGLGQQRVRVPAGVDLHRNLEV